MKIVMREVQKNVGKGRKWVPELFSTVSNEHAEALVNHLNGNLGGENTRFSIPALPHFENVAAFEAKQEEIVKAEATAKAEKLAKKVNIDRLSDEEVKALMVQLQARQNAVDDGEEVIIEDETSDNTAAVAA